MQKYDVWSIHNNNSRWSMKVWEDEKNKVWRFDMQVVLIKVSKYGVWRNSQQQLPHDARERRLCHESLSGRFRAGSSKPGKTTTTCSSSPSWSRSSPTEYKEITNNFISSELRPFSRRRAPGGWSRCSQSRQDLNHLAPLDPRWCKRAPPRWWLHCNDDDDLQGVPK